MRLTFLGKESNHGDSPTLYATDRGSYLFQGYLVDDPAVLSDLDIPDGDAVVRIYARLMPHLAKDGLSGIVERWITPIVKVLEDGDLIIRGVAVTDPEVLAEMAVPAHEGAVEVTKSAVRAVLRE